MSQFDLLTADILPPSASSFLVAAAHAPARASVMPPPVKPAKAPVPAKAKEVVTQSSFKSISETAEMLALPQHVLRFWESKFPQIKPLKLKGGRRYYRPQDIETLYTIKHLLYKQGYTIKGARKALAEAKKQPDIIASSPVRQVEAPKVVADVPASMEPKPAVAVAKPASSPRKDQLRAIHKELLALRGQLEAVKVC